MRYLIISSLILGGVIGGHFFGLMGAGVGSVIAVGMLIGLVLARRIKVF